MRYALALIILLGCIFVFTRSWFTQEKSPEEVIKIVVESIYTLDTETLRDNLCASQQIYILDPSEDKLAEAKNTEYDLSNIIYELVDIQEDSAIVRLSGTVITKTDGEETRTLLSTEDLTMLREDGHWVMCPDYGPPIDQSTPESTAHIFIENYFVPESTVVTILTCSARQDNLALDQDTVESLFMYYDLTNLELDIIDETENTATLQLSGSIDDYQFNEYTQTFLIEDITTDLNIPLVKEDSKWFICPPEGSSWLTTIQREH